MVQTSIPYYQLTPSETLDALQSTAQWLTQSEIIKRMNIYWPNVLVQINTESFVFKFFKQFRDWILIILISNAIIAYGINDHRTALVLTIIVIVNAIIWFVQEYKAEKTIQHLKEMVKSKTSVMRAGLMIEIDSEQLVPWDIVKIEEGMIVPADLRIIQECNLSSNDCALTGESNPVRKYIHPIGPTESLAERNNLLYMGTTIATWNAQWVVIYTGMDTLIWHIADLSQHTDTDDSPLQKEIKHLSIVLSIATIVIWFFLILIAIAVDMNLYQAFLFALWIASAMMPQWLPSQINVALATASSRLAKQHVIVKKLSAVETIGAISMICTDKTGTLTKNQMTVVACVIWWKSFTVSGNGYEPIWLLDPSLNTITPNQQFIVSETVNQYDIFFYSGMFASNASIHTPDQDHKTRYCLWDPTEWAVITLAMKCGYNPINLNIQYPEIQEFPFDSARKMMSSVRKIWDDYFLFVKGAVDQIINKSHQYRSTDMCQILTDISKKTILEQTDYYASQALRNIWFAYKILSKEEVLLIQDESSWSDRSYETLEQWLTYLWMVSMIDPPRDEVKHAMQYTHDAHIQINMITWDYGITAQAIADRIGMIHKDEYSVVISGSEIKNKQDQELLDILEHWPVIFCRVSPEDKMHIVSLLKDAWHIIAVTWDGVNDAPALKKADIGVAMGITGTDVAKDSAQMIIMDDNFATLVKAIAQWRTIFNNIKKTIIACITTNFTELFITLIGLMMLSLKWRPIALTPLLILCIDLVWEMFPLAALTFDPADPGTNKDHPRHINHHILNRSAMISIVVSGFVMAIIGYGTFVFTYRYHGYPIVWSSQSPFYHSAVTLSYVTIILCQFANILVVRSGTQSSVFTKYIWSNLQLLLSFGISIFFVLNIVYNPRITSYLWTWPLDRVDWLIAICGWMIYMIYREIYRRLTLPISTS